MQSTDLTPVNGTSPFDSIKQARPDGSEFWSARDLMPLLDYDSYRRFADAIERAKSAASAQGHDVENLFADAVKKSSGGRPAEDVELARFACYLVAMNGDPRKPAVAAAQSYFAVRTREAETRPAVDVAAITRADLARMVIESEENAERERAARIEAEDHARALEPKAEYVDTYVADEDHLTFRTVASTLDMGEKELRDLLVTKGWIYCETTTRWSNRKNKLVTVNRYSEYSHKKPYFYRSLTHDAPRFRGEVMHTLKITAPGAQAVARLVKRGEDGPALAVVAS